MPVFVDSMAKYISLFGGIDGKPPKREGPNRTTLEMSDVHPTPKSAGPARFTAHGLTDHQEMVLLQALADHAEIGTKCVVEVMTIEEGMQLLIRYAECHPGLRMPIVNMPPSHELLARSTQNGHTEADLAPGKSRRPIDGETPGDAKMSDQISS